MPALVRNVPVQLLISEPVSHAEAYRPSSASDILRLASFRADIIQTISSAGAAAFSAADREGFG
jgi:hypothetical protein